MKTYSGESTGGVFVEEDGERHCLDSRNDLRDHSPDGFSWGYGGSGPSQLALALTADMLGNDRAALKCYMDLKWAFVARLPQGKSWTATEDDLRRALAHEPSQL